MAENRARYEIDMRLDKNMSKIKTMRYYPEKGTPHSGPKPKKGRRRPMTWQERIVIDPEILVGKPVIRGTRLSVIEDGTFSGACVTCPAVF